MADPTPTAVRPVGVGRRPEWLWFCVPGVLLLGCLATALAGRHLSAAHGAAAALHALVGMTGLMLSLGAAAWVTRPRNRVPHRTALTMTCTLISLGIALVDLAMLAGLALTRVMAGF